MQEVTGRCPALELDVDLDLPVVVLVLLVLLLESLWTFWSSSLFVVFFRFLEADFVVVALLLVELFFLFTEDVVCVGPDTRTFSSVSGSCFGTTPFCLVGMINN